jgi:hypothetical protein
MILPIEGDETSGWKPGKPSVFLNATANEAEPMFSPDGRWIAYLSSDARAGRSIEKVLERNFGIFTTGFAACNHPLGLLKSGGVDQDDVLLFGSRVEEIAHAVQPETFNPKPSASRTNRQILSPA